ncbi:hypothetical protein [uncultured Mucilaginibacter sp.]|uniref:hypothetical protein n=1 Tax=uncultured Mucilaginibacter sp. TaxID=797541 RepID=UPI0025F4F63D|nr:hypothetical protein [uncultured Mucilaginibacter sp.]
MYIDQVYFNKLNLQFGDLIYLMIETGEGFNGTYQDGFDGSTFLFTNFSNGKTQKIALCNLQQLEKVKNQTN